MPTDAPPPRSPGATESAAPTLRRIERGDPTVASGLYLEVTVVLSVPIFGVERREPAELASQGKRDIALLPPQVRTTHLEIDDNFGRRRCGPGGAACATCAGAMG